MMESVKKGPSCRVFTFRRENTDRTLSLVLRLRVEFYYPYLLPLHPTLRQPYPKPNLNHFTIRNSRLTDTEISHDSGMSFVTGNSEHSTRTSKTCGASQTSVRRLQQICYVLQKTESTATSIQPGAINALLSDLHIKQHPSALATQPSNSRRASAS